jgi:hypothetical protein
MAESANASKVFSGARAVLKIGAQTVGYMLAVTGSTAINYAPIEGCGSLAVLEHVPIGYTVEMTAQLSRLAAFTRMASQTAMPLPDAGGEAGSVTATSPQIMPAFGTDGMGILKSGGMTAYIYDQVTAANVYTVKGVKCTTKSWDISGRAPVAENCNFVARLMIDQGENTSEIYSTNSELA